jgi:Tfp pilus assembly protein FimT
MGQQQQTVAGSALRRMLLVLAVAALMAALVAVMATPAFAKLTTERCLELNERLERGGHLVAPPPCLPLIS